MEKLSERVVLITGATGALGSVVSRVFAGTEALLALTSRSSEDLQKLVVDLVLPPDRAFTVVADATDPDQVQELIDVVVAHYGRVDALLNTVGGWGGGEPVGETPLEDWEHMLTLNLQTAFLLSRAVLPPMLEEGWGRILHVGSKTGVEPRATEVGYAVAKRGVIALTEVIAAEVKGTGVTANVILPSIIDTPANRRYMPKANPDKWVPPERIAHLMRFLCTDAGASINGVSIPIYGAI